MRAGSTVPGSPLPVAAWALVLAVLGSWLLAAVASLTGVAPASSPDPTPLSGSATAPADAGEDGGGTGAPVVLVGIPGLTWDLVGDDTPTLQRLAGTGGSAALVARGTALTTCADGAWSSVAAGERAGAVTADCRSTTPVGLDADGGDATAAGPDLSRLSWLAEEGGTCVATYGLDPALVGGAAETSADGLTGPLTLDPGCRIHLVAAPAVLPGDRSDTLGRVDAALGELALPAGSTLVVSGMGQTSDLAAAQLLVVAPTRGDETAPTLLTSSSTRQAGLVQLVDLTPTLLDLAGVDPPGTGLPGGAVAHASDPAGTGRPPSAASPDEAAAGLATAVTLAMSLTPWVLGALAVLLVPLLATGLALRGHRRGRRLLAGVATTILAFPVAAFLAGLVPWWSTGQPWPVLTALVFGTAVIIAVGALGLCRSWPSPLAAPAVVSAVTAVVLGVDVIWSARLGLVSVLGLQPVTAGRFYGQGNVGFGILLGAVLVMMAACVSWLVDRRAAALAVALLGAGAVLLGAAPQAGADFGSVPALVVGTGLVLLTVLGRRWTPRALLLVGGGALVLGAGVMTLDWLRGEGSRTHLGTFVQAVLDGEALGIVTRKLEQSLGILVGYPLSWLAVLALVGVLALVLRRPGRLDALWAEPGIPAVAPAAVVAMVLAWVLNDSGIASVASCLTMLIAAAVVVTALSPAGSAAGERAAAAEGAAAAGPGGAATPAGRGPAAGDRASGTGR